MALSRFNSVFHVFLWLQTASAYVEPPTNVTLHCHNLQNILKWTYGQVSPGLRFKVNIGRYFSSSDVRWVEPPHLEADLSFLNDPDEQYFLQVNAVIGENYSEAVPSQGISFSYFKDSPVQQKCSLDLPQVNVTAQPDAIIQFRFLHPWLLYEPKLKDVQNPKRRSKKGRDSPMDKPLPDFKYDVVINNQAHHEFTCVEDVCEETLPVNATQDKHCLKITGELKKMAVKSTQSFCALPLTKLPNYSNNHIYVILGLVAVLSAAGFVFFMLYRKKTKPSTSLPPTILNIDRQTVNHQTLGAEKVDITVPEIEPASPTPLLTKDEFTCAVTQRSYHMPLRCTTEDEGVCDVEEPSNERSAYMDGSGMEDELLNSINARSDYERREALVSVELGPDERAEGYRG